MPRRILTDELWSKLKRILRQLRIYDKPFLRDMVEGMLYRMRVGCPWRDLPKEFGYWNTIFQKFNRWSAKNKLVMVFKMLVHEPDLEWEFVDGSIIKAHQHSTGAASNEGQGIGKSVAGYTSKIHMAADAYGLPIDFEITGGEVHDCKNARKFINKRPVSDCLIADKGYDNEFLREHHVPILVDTTLDQLSHVYASATQFVSHALCGIQNSLRGAMASQIR